MKPSWELQCKWIKGEPFTPEESLIWSEFYKITMEEIQSLPRLQELFKKMNPDMNKDE